MTIALRPDPTLLKRLQAEAKKRGLVLPRVGNIAAAIKPPEFRGAALAIQSVAAREWVISGPAETGKTYASMFLLDRLARKTPKAICAILRKVHKDLYGPGNVATEYAKHFEKDGVTHHGGEKPEWLDYPNGARIYFGGLDRPGAYLSGALDFVYVNQAEELAADDWEVLTTRTTGRAGNTPDPMCFADCNPGPPGHWLLSRDGLTMLHSKHEDNPTLFNADGTITPRGEKSIATLNKLTGVRKERLRFGRWVSAEGAVYAFDPSTHWLDPFPIPAEWRRIRAIDFGYTNPFVCQWWAIDPDGRMYLYREIYMTHRTVRVHAAQINALSEGETIEANISDHDAEDRATLEECGIYTIAANKEVSPGIEAVQTRYKVAGDGKPRIFILKGCLVERDESLAARHLPLCTRDEEDVYLWPKAADGKPIKDAPVKMNDHAQDAKRYAVRYIDPPGIGGPLFYE